MRAGYTLGLVLAAAVWAFAGGPAHAQSCGKTYEVKRGDSLSAIAYRAYQNGSRWSLIYYANQPIIGKNPSRIRIGQIFRIPCADGQAAAEDTSQPSEQKLRAAYRRDGKVTLLTADDYRPFTDRGLPAGGLITDVVRTALNGQIEDGNGPAFKISWVNDWSAHLNPLLSEGAFDMGFPWFRPNCERYDDLDDPAKFRCDTFHFSKPVFEILVLFFIRKDAGFEFTRDEQVVGKRLCRPSGYFTFDLDKDGRNWVKDEKVTLLRPQGVDECFQMLARDEVDAVAINEFTGREAVRKLNMNDDVRTIENPVSVLNLHVIVPKTHPHADRLLTNVNQALQRIRDSGKYGEIVERHLAEFWKSQGAS
ncbi:MAG: LysM peptidoglycan-binding domain-containing protein [Hyphomicrobiales bacterium]